jgi:hypothetical protein
VYGLGFIFGVGLLFVFLFGWEFWVGVILQRRHGMVSSLFFGVPFPLTPNGGRLPMCFLTE